MLPKSFVCVNGFDEVIDLPQNCTFTFCPYVYFCIISGTHKLLMIKRKDEKSEKWELPGGLLEGAEVLEHAVLRLLNTQLGITKKIAFSSPFHVSASIGRCEHPKEENAKVVHILAYFFHLTFAGLEIETLKVNQFQVKEVVWKNLPDLMPHMCRPWQFGGVEIRKRKLY